MLRLISTLIALASVTVLAQTRTYWPVTVQALAAGQVVHTHVSVTGLVTYTRLEDDGDLHLRLAADSTGSPFIVAECIPLLPCRRPVVGRWVTVRGITRFDPEHRWWEVHPVEWESP